jgi:hypothetical protein
MLRGRLLIREAGLYGAEVEIVEYDETVVIVRLIQETQRVKVKRSEVEFRLPRNNDYERDEF